MGFNRLASKARAAILNTVAAAVPTITFTGHTDPTTVNHYDAFTPRTKRVAGETLTPSKTLPCVSYTTNDETPEIHGTGNKRVPCMIRVESRADADESVDTDDPKANHDDLSQAVFDVVMDDTISATLSLATAEFHVFEVFDMGESSEEIDDTNVFVTVRHIDLICCPVALS